MCVEVRPDLAARGIPDMQIQAGPISTPSTPGDTQNSSNANVPDSFNAEYNYDNPSGDFRKGHVANGFTFLPTLLHPKCVSR